MLNQVSYKTTAPLTVTQANQTPQEDTINQVLLINGIASVDEAINGIANDMRNELNQKRSIRQDISSVTSISNQIPVKTEDGTKLYEVSDAQSSLLNRLSEGKLSYTNLNGKKYVTQEQLTNIKDNLNEDLNGLNSGSEVRAIQLQSLMDQRKNMVTMMSNILASNTESLSNIIRNIK